MWNTAYRREKPWDFQESVVCCVQDVAGAKDSIYGWDWREKSRTGHGNLRGPS